MAQGVLPNASATQVELVFGQRHEVIRVYDGDRVGHRRGGGGLVAAEPVHGHDLDAVAEAWLAGGQPTGQAAAERPAGTRSSSRAGPVLSSTVIRSVITVTDPCASPVREWEQRCSSTPLTRTPFRRGGPAVSSAQRRRRELQRRATPPCVMRAGARALLGAARVADDRGRVRNLALTLRCSVSTRGSTLDEEGVTRAVRLAARTSTRSASRSDLAPWSPPPSRLAGSEPPGQGYRPPRSAQHRPPQKGGVGLGG